MFKKKKCCINIRTFFANYRHGIVWVVHLFFSVQHSVAFRIKSTSWPIPLMLFLTFVFISAQWRSTNRLPFHRCAVGPSVQSCCGGSCPLLVVTLTVLPPCRFWSPGGPFNRNFRRHLIGFTQIIDTSCISMLDAWCLKIIGALIIEHFLRTVGMGLYS